MTGRSIVQLSIVLRPERNPTYSKILNKTVRNPHRESSPCLSSLSHEVTTLHPHTANTEQNNADLALGVNVSGLAFAVLVGKHPSHPFCPCKLIDAGGWPETLADHAYLSSRKRNGRIVLSFC